MIRTILIVLTMIVLVGCDKAKDDYANCIKLEQTNDPEGALRACNKAVELDPKSKSGEAAAVRVMDLRATVYKLELAKREAELKERMKSVTPEQQAAGAQALQALRAKIHRSRSDRYSDDHCAGEGKPVHAYRYGGGTFSENESLASSDGCVPYDKDAMAVAGNAQNHFCCP